MKSVNVAELKNSLSRYLNEVRSGQEIVVRDRNTPIARILPIGQGENDDEQLLSLAAEGKLRIGGGTVDDSFWELPAPRVPPEHLRKVIESERDET